jgi:hypothetical protein
MCDKTALFYYIFVVIKGYYLLFLLSYSVSSQSAGSEMKTLT